jgi:lipopolysaccharide heptosyltransferase I
VDLSRILIIKPSSLGDVIQTLPVAWALRERYPRSRIDWLVMPGCASVLEGLDAIDNLLLFDRRLYGQMWRSPRSMIAFGWFLYKLRKPRYSAVLDLQGLFRSGFLAYASGARLRVGLGDARESADRFYNKIVDVPRGPISSVDRYMLLPESLGAPHDAPRRFDIAITGAHRARARQLLTDSLDPHAVTPAGDAGPVDLAERPYVVLVPAARWSTKRWPEERFAAVAQRLDEGLGLTPVLVGGKDDVEISARIRRMRGGRMINLIGRTDLRTLAAVMDGAACVVTGDTGPMHLAAAVGRPIVALFGPTNAETTGPYGLQHRILTDRADCARCGRRSCMWEGQKDELMCLRNISVDDVVEAVRQLIEAEGAERRQ